MMVSVERNNERRTKWRLTKMGRIGEEQDNTTDLVLDL